MKDVTVTFETTPNPQSMKFVISETIANDTIHITDPIDANLSPLAHKIFGFPWASGVSIGENFVTISKEDWVDWDIIAEPLSDLIKEHIDQNSPVIVEAPKVSQEDISANDSDIVKQIKTVINEEIKPAVAMDGGDVSFAKYEDYIVYIYMQGACSGCPSATVTLKQGIETRIKNAVPEVQEVVAL